ncbi:MAG TPA: EamA family transporter [Usitatibacter sp.]|nr:EamA family transporter [Usitatibacter sp.]
MTGTPATGRQAVFAALGAALLFGAGTPLAKMVLGRADPWMVAALLYLGSGAGLLAYRVVTRAAKANLSRREAGWFAAAIAAGGVVGPILLMYGLAGMPASGASLLLNAEAVFTALIAWFVFRENFDRRIASGMALIVAGAVAIAWQGEVSLGTFAPALAVLGACLAWAVDNNLTRKVALADATFIAMWKGLAAGAVNVVLAIAVVDARWPAPALVAATMALGFAAYGVSLALFVVALRGLGTARTGAYFSTAPFAGAALAIALLGEPLTANLVAGAVLMAAGVWLHLSERHEHSHTHVPTSHSHEHDHDEHHRHAHGPCDPPGEPHTHEHAHAALTHRHPHYPDTHHRHGHSH